MQRNVFELLSFLTICFFIIITYFIINDNKTEMNEYNKYGKWIELDGSANILEYNTKAIINDDTTNIVNISFNITNIHNGARPFEFITFIDYIDSTEYIQTGTLKLFKLKPLENIKALKIYKEFNIENYKIADVNEYTVNTFMQNRHQAHLLYDSNIYIFNIDTLTQQAIKAIQ